MTRLIAFGDSIFAGWDGKENVSANQRIPELIAQQLGWQVTNVAIGGTKYDDSSNGFTAMVNKTDVTGFNYALVSYGVNNFSWPDPLVVVKQNALNGFKALKKKNPQLKILLELPTEDFRNGSTTLFDMNSQGWTQNQLDDELISVAKQEGIDYYDWRPDPIITYANANQTLGDGNTGVHPTPETGKKIAARLAEKFREMETGKPAQPTQPSIPNWPDQPTTPVQPTQSKPVVKLISTLKIKRLDNPFAVGDNVEQGMQTTVNKANELYKTLARVEGLIDVPTASLNRHSPGNELERPLRNYVVLSFNEVTSPINDLVHQFNKYWIRDPNQPIDIVELLRPDKLALDSHYVDTINYDWYLIENKVNELIGYMNKLIKGE